VTDLDLPGAGEDIYHGGHGAHGEAKVGLSHGSSLSERVIKSAIEVHRHLGPGLLESTYEECLCFELAQSGIVFRRQVPLAVVYKEVRLDCGYRVDIAVEQELIVEVKSVERLMPIHDAQVLTYLRLSGYKVGLLMDFNTLMLKDGLRRFVL
jgi:GxxExxY protein